MEQKQINITFVGFVTIEELLNMAIDRVKNNNDGGGWYLQKLERINSNEYLVALERKTK